MSEKFEKFTKALEALINEGDMLHMAIQYDCYGDDFVNSVRGNLSDEKIEKFLKKLPNFKENYQAWYSEAQSLLKQVLPDRLSDFQAFYEYPRVRKEINFQNYMIRDYLQGLKITGWGEKVIADGSSAVPEFVQQLNIVKAAKKMLNSTLIAMTTIMQADLFDSEVEAPARF